MMCPTWNRNPPIPHQIGCPLALSTSTKCRWNPCYRWPNTRIGWRPWELTRRWWRETRPLLAVHLWQNHANDNAESTYILWSYTMPKGIQLMHYLSHCSLQSSLYYGYVICKFRKIPSFVRPVASLPQQPQYGCSFCTVSRPVCILWFTLSYARRNRTWFELYLSCCAKSLSWLALIDCLLKSKSKMTRTQNLAR